MICNFADHGLSHHLSLAGPLALQLTGTGLLAWEHGQPGQVGNQAALTGELSAGVRLVTRQRLAGFESFSVRAPAPFVGILYPRVWAAI